MTPRGGVLIATGASGDNVPVRMPMGGQRVVKENPTRRRPRAVAGGCVPVCKPYRAPLLRALVKFTPSLDRLAGAEGSKHGSDSFFDRETIIKAAVRVKMEHWSSELG